MRYFHREDILKLVDLAVNHRLMFPRKPRTKQPRVSIFKKIMIMHLAGALNKPLNQVCLKLRLSESTVKRHIKVFKENNECLVEEVHEKYQKLQYKLDIIEKICFGT